MLKSHPDRVCVFFTADYEPLVGFQTKLASAAEAVQTRLKAPHWSANATIYVFRNTVQRLIFVLDSRRVSFQAIGLEVWQKNLDEYAALMKLALQKLGVDKLKRIGFQSQAYLPIGMSHGEMAALMFGSFLAPADDLHEVCGKLEDALAQLHGEQENMKLQLIVAPMTAEQVVQQLMVTPNLEFFLEPKLFDAGLKDFKERIAVECLHVSVDLSRTEVSDSEIPLFSRKSLDTADRITEAAVQKLKSLRVKKGR